MLARLVSLVLLGAMATAAVSAQSLLSEIKAEHDPVKRSDLALNFAGSAFDNARDFYAKGDVQKGDAQLEDMTNALNECLSSLESAHKARFYKKAEQRVAFLQRRMQGLLDDISLPQRGWAEYTSRKLDEIHDRLLDGVMKK